MSKASDVPTQAIPTKPRAAAHAVQSYLAGDKALSAFVEAANLGPLDKGRARFIASLLIDALAPSNLLLTNPAALRKLVDTGGMNLIRGARQFSNDPWPGCYGTARLFGEDSTFVLSNAGHLQSLVNPPGNPKAHSYAAAAAAGDPQEWLEGAGERHGGSW